MLKILGFKEHLDKIKALPEERKAEIRNQLFRKLGLKPIPSGTIKSVEAGIHRDNALAVTKAEGYQPPRPATLAPEKSYTPAQSPVQLAPPPEVSVGLGGLPPVKVEKELPVKGTPQATSQFLHPMGNDEPLDQ